MKRNISDLMDACCDPDIDLKLETPLSSERIKELTMSKITEEKKPQKRRITFRVMMAAAIIVALAVSAFAAGSGAAWFQTFFAGQNEDGLTDEQMALIEQNAVAIDQSRTVDGYTINVESVMNDERNIYIKLNLYAPEGVALPYGDNRHFGSIALYDLAGEPVVVHSWGMEETIDEDKTDNHVEMYMIFRFEENTDTSFLQADGGLTLELTNLFKTYGRPLSQKTELVAGGTWRFDLAFTTIEEVRWKCELISEPVDCVVPRFAAEEGDVEIRLISVCLHPLGMDVEYDFSATEEMGGLKWLGIKAVKLDGTAVMMSPSAENQIPEETGTKGYATLDADAPIVLEEIAYIEFPGGTQIPVNTEE